MTLTEVIDQYLLDGENRGRVEGTLGVYRRVLRLLVHWLGLVGVVEVEGVTLPLLRQFLNFLLHSDSAERFPDAVQKGRLAPSTVGSYVAALKAFFQWCVNEGLLASSPAARACRNRRLRKRSRDAHR